MNWLKSKTIWGAVIAVVGFLAQPQVLAVLPEKVAAIVTAVGTVLAVFGLRHAVARTEEKVELAVGVAAADKNAKVVTK